jgi:hypothetical protein
MPPLALNLNDTATLNELPQYGEFDACGVVVFVGRLEVERRAPQRRGRVLVPLAAAARPGVGDAALRALGVQRARRRARRVQGRRLSSRSPTSS